MNSPLVIEAVTKHTASLIFLHGLGDSGHGWIPVMRQLSKVFRFMKFICPNAPNQKVTLNGGMKMPSWYDIYTLSESDEREDENGLRESTRTVLDLIEGEKAKGIPHDRIFIGGFSQGGAVSIFTALTNPQITLGGVLSLSSYVPCRKLFQRENANTSLTSPLFMGHGTSDMVIPYHWHQKSVAYLKSLPQHAAITTHKYDGMDHSACEEEIQDMIEFITQKLDAHQITKNEL